MANDKKFVVKNGLTTQNVSFVDDITNPTTTQTITLTDIGNWDTAYSWGDHSTAGYLTSYTETDPVFAAAPAAGITSTDISNWDEAHGWGNHASAGYLTSETVTSLSLATNILTYTDENGATTELDLSLYLDDTNLARLVSGSLDGGTGIATFTRDDESTFTVDFSPLFDDTNLARITSASFGTADGVLTLTRDDESSVTVDLDGRYLEDAPSDGSQYARQNGAWAVVTGGGSAASLNELSDVTLSSVASGDLLYYNGANFVNASANNLGIVTEDVLNNTTNVEDTFTANGSTTDFTLSEAPPSAENILVSVDGVIQPSSAYSVDNLTLTITPALSDGTSIRVLHLKTLAIGTGTLVKSDPTEVTGADVVTNVISLTQAEYDGITPDSSTFYIITG